MDILKRERERGREEKVERKRKERNKDKRMDESKPFSIIIKNNMSTHYY